MDLIAGGHVELFFTEREYECARTDYEAAKAAGADLHEVEWLNREETEVVSFAFVLFIIMNVLFVFHMIIADGLRASTRNMARAIRPFVFQGTIYGHTK